MGRKKTGGLQRRGDAWRISYRAEGKRYFETFQSQEQAQRELACRLADAARGIPVSSAPNMVLFGELAAEVIREYRMNGRRSIEDLKRRFRLRINPVFAQRKAASITTPELNAYIARRRQEKFRGVLPSNGTINRELEAIRHVFRFALQNGRLLYMPHIPHLVERNTREGFFTRAEVDALCAELPQALSLFVKFGYLTGWRLGEIQNLKWANVDFVSSELRLFPSETKKYRGRVFPITAELRSLLESALALPREKSKPKKTRKLRETLKGMVQAAAVRKPAIKKVALIPVPNVFHVYNRMIREFRKTWARACQRAGLPVTIETETVAITRGKDKGKVVERPKRIVALRIFHDLRRSAAKALTGQGIPERVVMELCGWKTRSVFDRYSVVGKPDLDFARERMNLSRNETTFAAPLGPKIPGFGAEEIAAIGKPLN